MDSSDSSILDSLEKANLLDSQFDRLAAIAELCKTDARDYIGKKTGVIRECLAVLRQEIDNQTKLQALRVLGNLCYNHADNRVLILNEPQSLELILTVLRAFQQTPKLPENERLRILSGSLLVNISDDNDTIQEVLIQHGVISLLSLILSESLVDSTGVVSCTNDATYTSKHALRMLLSAKGAIASVASTNLVSSLVILLRALALSPDAKEEGDEEDEEDDDDNDRAEKIEGVVEFLRELFEQEALFESFATTQNVDILIELATTAKNIDVSRLCALFLSVVVSKETVASRLGGHSHDGQLIAFVSRWLHSQDNSFRTAGAICVGNLCRSDESAQKIIAQDDIMTQLLSMLTDDDGKVAHAGFGAIKNLAIAPANKFILIGKNIAKLLLIGLQSAHTPIQYHAASTLRSLCIQQTPETVMSIVTTPNLVSRLAHLTQSEDFPVKVESARALANFLRFSKDITACREIVINNGIVGILFLLSCTEQIILVSDALISLLLLVAQSSEFLPTLFEAGVMPLLLKIVDLQDVQFEIKCNAISLGRALLAHAPCRESEDGRRLISAARAQAVNAPQSEGVQQLIASFADL